MPSEAWIFSGRATGLRLGRAVLGRALLLAPPGGAEDLEGGVGDEGQGQVGKEGNHGPGEVRVELSEQVGPRGAVGEAEDHGAEAEGPMGVVEVDARGVVLARAEVGHDRLRAPEGHHRAPDHKVGRHHGLPKEGAQLHDRDNESREGREEPGCVEGPVGLDPGGVLVLEAAGGGDARGDEEPPAEEHQGAVQEPELLLGARLGALFAREEVYLEGAAGADGVRRREVVGPRVPGDDHRHLAPDVDPRVPVDREVQRRGAVSHVEGLVRHCCLEQRVRRGLDEGARAVASELDLAEPRGGPPPGGRGRRSFRCLERPGTPRRATPRTPPLRGWLRRLSPRGKPSAAGRRRCRGCTRSRGASRGCTCRPPRPPSSHRRPSLRHGRDRSDHDGRLR